MLLLNLIVNTTYK